MAEYVRSVTATIEVDTNKQTYALNLEGVGVGEIQRKIDRFIEDLGFRDMAVGK